MPVVLNNTKPNISDRFGRFLTIETAQKSLQINSYQELKERTDNNYLLRVETVDGKQLYPELQFDDAGVIVKGLPKILQVLLPFAADGWTVLYWLTAPLDSFNGRTAIEVMRSADASETKTILKMAEHDAAVWKNVSQV